MLFNFIFTILCCCVYGVVSISPFFEKGQRAEIYELMDDEIPTMRINLPDDKFEGLKDQFKDITDPINLKQDLPNIAEHIKYRLKLYKKINFTDFFPDCNFNEILPQLQIGEDGYAKYDIEEVFSGYDYNPVHYKELNFNNKNILEEMVFKSNKNFDLLEIIEIFNDLINKMEIDRFKIYETMEEIYFESWEVEQFNKYVNYSIEEETESNFIEEDYENNSIKFNEDEYDYKIKNATMSFEIKGKLSFFKNITFKLSGGLSRSFSKPSYNIKIKSGQDLYGRSNFKLRSDMRDPSLLRSKLVSDIRNRVGIKSISTNYVHLYINDEFMGLYIMTDVINLPWIENVYGDKKTTSLYKCDSFDDFISEHWNWNKNKNEDVTDHSEWINFLKAVENAKSASDIEDIFDIERFLYEMAIDYLTNAFDHDIHNFYFYKQPNGKWAYISYDYDLDYDYAINFKMPYEDYFKNVSNKSRLYDLLISQDEDKFNNIVKDVVKRVINPGTLYPHIDEIKQLIKPSVLLDKTPDSNGKYPGAINENYLNGLYTFEQWDDSSEFTLNDPYIGTGLKYIILMKYRYICNKLNMECDPLYMDDNYLNENNIFLEYYTEIPTEILTEYSFEIQTDIPILFSTEIQTEYFTTSSSVENYTEKETVYEVDVPTQTIDEESSTDEEDTTESVESIPESVTIKTITKTQTVIYKTISN